MDDQPKAESQVLGWPKSTSWPLRWRLAKRILGAAVLFTLGLLSARSGHDLGVRYGFTNADIVSEKAVGSGSGHSGVRAEVHFRQPNGTPVTAYIHLDHRLAPGKLIPIYFKNAAPRTAGYAGASSSVSLDVVRAGYVMAAVFFAVFLVVLAFGVIWWCRTTAIMRRAWTGDEVQLRWYSDPPIVTVMSQPDDEQYTWRVLPLDSPVDWALRFLGLLRAAAAAQQRPKLSAIFVSAKQRASATRPALTEEGEAEASRELGTHRWIALRSVGILLVPTSRTEPVIGTGQAPKPPLTGVDALVRAHRRLLAAYSSVLYEVARLPRLTRPPANEGRPVARLRTVLCWRLVVRLHLESHIRRQLRRLAKAYAKAQVLITDTGSNADEKRRSMTELREECEMLSSSVADAPRRIGSWIIAVATLIPVIAAVIRTPQLNLSKVGLGAIFEYILVILLILPGFFALMAFRDAFRCKRQLFLFYTSSPLRPTASGNENVYQLENAVFAHLRQPKRPERPYDYWAQALVLSALIGAIIWSFFFPPVNIFSSVVLSLGALVWAGFLVLAFQRRRATAGVN